MILILSIPSFIGSYIGTRNEKEKAELSTGYSILLPKKYSEEFNKDSLIEFINKLNLDHKDIVYSQAVLESGNFNSKLFRETNNLFGMKVPSVRNNLSEGSQNGYQVYYSWKHSVLDYALWQSTYMHGKSRREYLEYLGRNYAEDPEYINKLNKIIRDNE